MEEKIFQMLFEEDEITWQTIIYDLVKKEEMDPWDVDVSVLTHRYIETIKTLKKFDFRVSGKVLLAAAILLKIKSNRLVGEDINELDRLIAGPEELDEAQFYEDLEQVGNAQRGLKYPGLIPRTPQPRKRKVSIYDLMGALEQALEVKKRRVMNSIPIYPEIPEKKVDISTIIKDVYGRIVGFFAGGNKKLNFSQLIPSDTKEGKVYTFIPLLHLSNQRKIDLLQEQHFGEIEIQLLRKMQNQEISKELGETTS